MTKRQKPPDPSDIQKIRRALRRDVARERDVARDITDEVLALLEADGTLPAYRTQHTEEAWRKLVTAARRHTRRTPGRRSKKEGAELDSDSGTMKPGDGKPAPPETLTAQEVERANVRSRYLARLAARRIPVVNLRRWLFGGRLLTLDQARKWLSLPTIRFFCREWFNKYGIPIVEHEAEITDPRTGGPITWGDDAVEHRIFNIRWPGGSRELPLRNINAPAPEVRRRVHVGFGSFYAQDGSIIDDIQRVAEDLERDFGWDEVGAAFVFIITGRPPRTPAVRYRLHELTAPNRRHISLELHIEPWVSIRSVARVYEHLQKRMRFKQSYARGELAFPMFEFVEEFIERKLTALQEAGEAIERFDDSGRSMVDVDWKEVANEWNASHPGEHVMPSRIERSYRKTFFTIAFPAYVNPRTVKKEDTGRNR